LAHHASAADLVVPISVSSVPKRWWGAAGPRETWQAWTDAGERAIRVTQPDWVNVHCARHIGLRTDYEPSSPAPSGIQQPYPKDGLALSPARPIEAIQTMLPDGAESRTVMSVLREAFNRAERETAGRFGHPIDRRERERIEPRPEAVYMFGESPRFVYVESVRPYLTKDATAGECSTLGFGTGWFIHDTDGVRPDAERVADVADHLGDRRDLQQRAQRAEQHRRAPVTAGRDDHAPLPHADLGHDQQRDQRGSQGVHHCVLSRHPFVHAWPPATPGPAGRRRTDGEPAGPGGLRRQSSMGTSYTWSVG
jgi:hypothetical protein